MMRRWLKSQQTWSFRVSVQIEDFNIIVDPATNSKHRMISSNDHNVSSSIWMRDETACKSASAHVQ